MADLVSEGGEFSCNFCTSKLKLSIINSSSTGDSKKLANQTNCFFPPPGGNCTFPPGVPPSPCPGIPPGSVISTGQSTVKIDGQTALGDGCKFLCPKGQPVALAKAGQAVAKHDEANSGVGAYVAGGCLVVGGVILAIALLPEEAAAAVVAGAAVAAKAVGKVAIKALKKVASKTKKGSKVPANTNKPNVQNKQPGKSPPSNQNQQPKSNKKSRSGHPEPLPEAEGRAHSIIEKPGKNGQYTTFNEDGTFKQYRGSGKPHGGIERPNIKENKIDPRSPKGLPSKATVRKPTPDEIPKGD